MPADRVQLAALKVPVLLVVKLTEPVGVPTVEVTVAVQVLAVLSKTLAGEHDTVVLVWVTPWVTASRKVPVLPV